MRHGLCPFDLGGHEDLGDRPVDLQDSTSGANSATILIADRRGKEEIAKALERVSEVAPEVTAPPVWRVLGLSWRNWIGVAIGFASGVLAWLVCAHHW